MFDSENGDFDIQKKHINDKGTYVITAGITNDGILGKSDIEAKIFDANTITVDMFGYPFYRDFKYKLVTHARVFSLIPKETIDKKSLLFISTSLKYLSHMFGYDNMCSYAKIKNMSIHLPVKNDNIDYDFMIDLISELEEERISELKKYLKVTGLDSYVLNSEEEKALVDFKNLNWGEFNYTELFELLKTKNKLNKMQLDENGKYDVYSAISTNNGIMGKTLLEPEYIIDQFTPYYICFGDHTRKFSVAKSSFSVMDNVKVLKTIETTELKSILFIITTWQKCIKDLGYSRHWKLAKNTKILLPIDSNGNIDYEYMNILISAIQKEVIKGVVDYADKNIDATKKVIRK